MSLSLAKTWVTVSIGKPAARADALRLLDQAASEGVEATLIVGPLLSTSGVCLLARWDGRELVVRELTLAQQQDWSVAPKGLFQQLEPIALPRATFTSQPLVSLTVSRLDGSDEHDGWTSLSGTCIAEPAVPTDVIVNSALRVEYFRPDLQRQVTQMWYTNRILPSEPTTLPFHFPPLFSTKNPQTLRGTLVVFFQLFTADDWRKPIDCRRISNVADAVVTLR